MPTYSIPQPISVLRDYPFLLGSGLDRERGEIPGSLMTMDSKKVDDISRHESRHDDAPKQAPKPNAREKTPDAARPDIYQPQGGKPFPGSVKK
jgi:hypothetical protein